jgi:hypothetical protein
MLLKIIALCDGGLLTLVDFIQRKIRPRPRQLLALGSVRNGDCIFTQIKGVKRQTKGAKRQTKGGHLP